MTADHGKKECDRSGQPTALALSLLLVGGCVGHLGDSGRRSVRHHTESAGSGVPSEHERLCAAAESSPEDAEAWRDLASYCYAVNLRGEAVNAWLESLRLEPGQAELHWRIGIVYWSEGNEEAAKAEYRAALAVDPDHLGSLYNLGALYRREGQLDKAERILVRAAELEVSASWQLGQVYADQERWDVAVEAFERSLGSLDRDDWGLAGIAMLHVDLGRARGALGRTREAIAALETALDAYRSLEEHPDSWDTAYARETARVLYLQARLVSRSGDPQRALSYLRRALRRAPELHEEARQEADLAVILPLLDATDQ